MDHYNDFVSKNNKLFLFFLCLITAVGVFCNTLLADFALTLKQIWTAYGIPLALSWCVIPFFTEQFHYEHDFKIL